MQGFLSENAEKIEKTLQKGLQEGGGYCFGNTLGRLGRGGVNSIGPINKDNLRKKIKIQAQGQYAPGFCARGGCRGVITKNLETPISFASER